MSDANLQHGRVTFLDGRGDLSALEITTPWSRAEIFPHGATVTQFQKTGEPPVLFLSQCSRYTNDAPIRGGIPIAFPWFGKPEGKTMQHGFARVKDWELKEVASPPDGSVTVRMRLPNYADATAWPGCNVEYVVTVGEALGVELIVTNKSASEAAYEDCLHTYFTVGDISQVAVIGLKGVEYLDALDGRKRKTETAESIRFTAELDRVYLNTAHVVEIHDAALRRVIRVAKEGSRSTVVWNPWIAKAKAMADYGDEEYKQMVCVESGNVAENQVKLRAGESHRTVVRISTTKI
ncbi:MAG: D-hexose-6-phosphate mutarotase [Verrucomicrobia bacterium]|nr:MAG: D-hexose-6-phosphate mutarotase [Verrucomicrobiota bacterium]